MADIAALGLAVDSDGLVKATDQLDKFSASADRAGKQSDKTAASTDRMDRGMSKAATDAARAAGSVDRYTSTLGRTSSEAARTGGAMTRLSGYLNNLIGRFRELGPATKQADAHMVAYRANLRATATAVNDNVASMGGSMSGLAAQFQDVGVTAAMGMSPLMVALQQGTQIAGQMEAASRGGASGLAVLGQSIKSLLSPTALMSIALVGVAAALIQMVDWAAATQAALNGLADILVDLAPYATAFAAAMALIYAPAVIAGIKNLTAQMWALRASILAVATTPAAVVAGLLAIVAAAIHFRDDLTRYLGFDIVQAAHDGINRIIGGFVGAYNTIIQVWRQLPAALGDAAYSAAETVRSALSGLFKVNGRDLFDFGGPISNPFEGALDNVGKIADETMRAAQGVDYVGRGVAAVRDLAGQAASKLREWSTAMGGGVGDGSAASDAADTEGRAGRARGEAGRGSGALKILENVKAIEPDLRAAWKNVNGYLRSMSRDIDEMIASRVKAAREVVGGFFATWYDGIRRGQNVFKSFADSVVGGLNRIIDRLMDRAIGGFLDALIGGTGGFIGRILGSANGNAFTSAGSVQRFANGGAFTNQVVNTPTLFRFANGAALGEMGEAGPEAVMPLKRGADGSLGVQMHGGGRGGVRIENNNNYSFAGAIGIDAIISMIRQGSEATQAQTKKQLSAWLQEYEANGAVA